MTTPRELTDELDMESWLDYEGVKHRLTKGHSGLQLNVKECPCCGNSKWKVYVNAETGVGNCFVCDERFTKWKFVAAQLGLSNSDVFTYLKNYAASQKWTFRSKRPQHMAVEQSVPALVMPPSHPIPIAGRNLKYLEDRAVTVELAEYFGLRYCHRGEFPFVDPNGNAARQIYDRRIIIPILNEDGKLASFQGRDILGTATQKYLFPPEFASTGSILYNAHRAFQSKRVIIGEGVFDAIAVHAAIQPDESLKDCVAVASFGKKLGDDQIRVLTRLKSEGQLEELIFMWDAETAALTAAVDAALKCRGFGFVTRVALLPKDKDPNEVPAEVVRNAIHKSIKVDTRSAVKLKLAALKMGKQDV